VLALGACTVSIPVSTGAVKCHHRRFMLPILSMTAAAH